MSARRRGPRRPRPAVGARRGFTMVELLVAMTLLAVATTGFTMATISLARSTRQMVWSAGRNATLLREANRISTTPFAMLPAAAGCVTVPAGAGQAFAYTRCIQVTNVSATERHVRVIAAATTAGLRPDTITVRRADVSTGTPF